MKNFKQTPRHDKYDVIIIGGAIMGSSTAWFLSQNPDFNGTILVVEKDQKYEFCSTAHTTSCIRQQFSTKLGAKLLADTGRSMCSGAKFIFLVFLNNQNCPIKVRILT